MRYLPLVLAFLLLGCSHIFKNDAPPITDADNNGYDDRDILFLQKLIDNSQGYTSAPSDTLDPKEIGTQIWVEGRLRSLKHSGGAGGFFLYGEIPAEIKDVEFLNKLYLEDNYFTSISNEISQLNNLSEIILNDNRFIGEVPEALWQNKPHIKNLSIFNNDFSSIPESVCDVYSDITNLVISHNNFCEVPSCIPNPGIQSCDCFDFITMDICIDVNANITCARTLGDVIENCALLPFWGDDVFTDLVNDSPDLCVSWEGNCSEIHSIGDDDVNFNLNTEDGCIDCKGNPCDESLSWVGDGNCDESENLSFSCPEFNCDMNDCGFYVDSQESCYCQRDCSGKCIDQSECGSEYWQAYGYDCCIDDGTCEDLNGDGAIGTWLGDGWCDDGTWGFNFNCQQVGDFEFACDAGDCGIWNEETGQCELGPGQAIQNLSDYKYNQNLEVE